MRARAAATGAAFAFLAALAALALAVPERCLDVAWPLVWWLVGRTDGSALLPGDGLALPATLAGQVAVLTGSSEGYGLRAARRFHALGASVVLSGEDAQAAAAAAAGLRKASATSSAEHGVKSGMAVGLLMDPANFTSTREFASAIAGLTTTVHVLVLNAVAEYPAARPPWGDSQTIASSGHDRLMAANHLGHFLLACLLAPSLAAQASVVVVGGASMWFGRPQWLMLHWGRPARPLSAVKPENAEARRGLGMEETSRLGLLVLARLLRPRLAARNVTVVAMTPGLAPRAGASAADEAEIREAGDLVFESAFLAVAPTPDFLYPYWFPEALFSWEAAVQKTGARRTAWARSCLSRPERLRFPGRPRLHASVGPKVRWATEQELWRWSRAAVGLPDSFDHGDVFQSGADFPQAVAAPRRPGGPASPEL